MGCWESCTPVSKERRNVADDACTGEASSGESGTGEACGIACWTTACFWEPLFWFRCFVIQVASIELNSILHFNQSDRIGGLGGKVQINQDFKI